MAYCQLHQRLMACIDSRSIFIWEFFTTFSLCSPRNAGEEEIFSLIPGHLKSARRRGQFNRRADGAVVSLSSQKKRPFRGVLLLATLQDYFAFISATVVSSMRFEKPHSLSYHDDTFTRRPDTLVRVASKFDEAGLWLKSTDTSGSVL